VVASEQENTNSSISRLQRIYRGDPILGFRKTKGIRELMPGNLFTFVYDAKTPGLKGTSLFDINPQVILMDIRSYKGKDVIIGLNTHYLSGFVEKRSTVLGTRRGMTIPKQLIEKACHAYRVNRIRSDIYTAVDLTADASIMLSKPVWQTVKATPGND